MLFLPRMLGIVDIDQWSSKGRIMKEECLWNVVGVSIKLMKEERGRAYK